MPILYHLYLKWWGLKLHPPTVGLFCGTKLETAMCFLSFQFPEGHPKNTQTQSPWTATSTNIQVTLPAFHSPMLRTRCIKALAVSGKDLSSWEPTRTETMLGKLLYGWACNEAICNRKCFTILEQIIAVFEPNTSSAFTMACSKEID